MPKSLPREEERQAFRKSWTAPWEEERHCPDKSFWEEDEALAWPKLRGRRYIASTLSNVLQIRTKDRQISANQLCAMRMAHGNFAAAGRREVPELPKQKRPIG